jgi:hypothetical protein
MDFSAFLAEINGLISLAWPEIPPMSTVPVRRDTSVQALRMSFVDKALQGTLDLPCVVIALGREVQSDIGVATGIYYVPLSIHYIAAAGTKQSTLHAKMAALRKLIDNPQTVFDSFQAGEERGRIDSSEGSDVNRHLVEAAGVQVASASVEWTPGLMVFGDLDA